MINPASLHGRTAIGMAGALRCVEFINHHPGYAASADALAKLAELPSVVSVVPAFDPGASLEPTRDLLTSPGYAYLAAPTLAELTRDYETLRVWELEGGLYTRDAGRLQSPSLVA